MERFPFGGLWVAQYMDETYRIIEFCKSAMVALASMIIDRYTINILNSLEKEGGMRVEVESSRICKTR